MNTYEVYGHDFSVIIHADTLTQACEIFEYRYPEEEIIFAENVEYRDEK